MNKATIRKEIKARAKVFVGTAQDKIMKACENFNFEFENMYEDVVCDIEMSLLTASFK